MNHVKKDTVTLYIPDKENTQGYVRYVLTKVMRRYSYGAINHGSEPDHGMVVYVFDIDGGDLSFLKRWGKKFPISSLEGYCADGIHTDTDTPWAIEGIYRIQSIRRYDTGSRWMAHWKLTCR